MSVAVPNEHIATTAALPRGIKNLLFLHAVARVENVLEAATAPSPKNVVRIWRTGFGKNP